VRHGTLSLYAALDTQTGLVIGQSAARHTSEEFVSFLKTVVASKPATREIHIIADNLSAHKTALVTAFLDRHPHVTLHYTPTYSSWLNQVELWFAKLRRDLLARDVFPSVTDLARSFDDPSRSTTTREAGALVICRSESAHLVTLGMTRTVH
jgi:transposase